LTILLRITAVVGLAWSGLLLFAPQALTGGPPDPVLRALAGSLAAVLVILAAAFLRASSEPESDLFTVGLAIATVASRVVIDLWGLLGDLPPEPALYFLVDLIVGFALLVGLLEALPRTVARSRSGASANGVGN
jgi:hypothetical protein